ncbi:RNA polymerase sigma factor [Nocardia sp. NPDC051570]|uniref:RNA polymerase sigma factor n=1 Tax=Nocardia sp. NPDC051570 TaxID=3364324 RepID=UPI0037A50BE2
MRMGGALARTAGDPDLAIATANAIAALPGPQRRILVLICYGHLSCPQAAAATRVPESVVKQQLHDGLHAIRTHLGRG